MDKTTALHSHLGWAASLLFVIGAAVVASPAGTLIADSVPLAAPLRLVEFAVLPADVRDGLARRLSVLRAFLVAGPPTCCHRG